MKTLFPLLFLSLLTACSATKLNELWLSRSELDTPKPEPVLAAKTYRAPDCSFAQPPQQRAENCNRALARTVNFGNIFDTPREGMGPRIRNEFITLSKAAGFTAIRLTVRWDARAAQKPPYTINPAFLGRIGSVIEFAVKHDLAVVIDMHHYKRMNANPKTEAPRFLAMWKQIAEYYRNEPATVMFEVLNEPRGLLNAKVWQRVMPQALKVIRASNPHRTLIVGGSPWNSRVALLDKLQLPASDRNLIATFHYYEPLEVTHQGAEWVPGSDAWLDTKCCTKVELKTIKDDFAEVAAWAKAHRRPVLLGEFGVYSKADDKTRRVWTTAVRQEAEASGFSWAYWELASTFGVLDALDLTWRKALLRTLLPNSPV